MGLIAREKRGVRERGRKGRAMTQAKARVVDGDAGTGLEDWWIDAPLAQALGVM